MKVLLVEDDILIRIFIKKGLLKNGCDEVFEASKADEALTNQIDGELIIDSSNNTVFTITFPTA